MSERDELIGKIQAAIADIVGDFDSIQVFATKVVEGDTISVNYGTGDYYARYGMTKYWLEVQNKDAKLGMEIRIIDE